MLRKSFIEAIAHSVIYLLGWPVMKFFGNGQMSYSFDWVRIPTEVRTAPIRMPASSVPVIQRRDKGSGFSILILLNRTHVKLGGWKQCAVIRSVTPDFYVGVQRGLEKEVCRRKVKGSRVAMMLGPGSVEVFAMNEEMEPVEVHLEGIYPIVNRPKGVPLY